jgi:hypothetical protein
LVCIFATFLYFFFQGYYPSFDFSLKSYFSSGEIHQPEDLVKSFGIINIRVEPRDARILLSGEELGNDEKKMVAYDEYTLSIGKPGYVQDWVDISIDRETPYYIDEVTLLPRATYMRISSGSVTFSRIWSDGWLAKNNSGYTLYDTTLFSGSLVETPSVPIGEWYYLDERIIYAYTDWIWERKTWSGSQTLIRECDSSLQVREWYLWCPKTEKAIDQKWKTHTGIIAIGDEYLRTERALYSLGKSYKLSESERREKRFIQKDSIWYIPSGGNLIPLMAHSGGAHPLITTPLEKIHYTEWLDDELIIFGKKWPDTFLICIRDDITSPLIPFPDIPLEEVRLTKIDGNIFFKTKNALLFLYNNSRRIEWIVDGEILAYSTRAAIYKKDGELWRASFGEKE